MKQEAIRDLVRAWRDDLAAGLGAAELSVTLYRWSRFRLWTWPPRAWWPWGFEGGLRHPLSGWLVPVEACGAPPLPPLLAPDDGSGEGFPALVWTRGRHYGEQLERLLPDPASEGYAARCGLPAGWLQKRPWLPRSQYGFVVESAGRPWGVLAAECSAPDLRAEAPVRRAARDLVGRLERALAEGA